MSTADVVVLVGAFSALIGSVLISVANYRNSVRKADLDRALARITDTEARLAQTEHRATTSEIQAQAFRHDVIQLGEQLDHERKLNDRNLAIVAKDAETKIEKLLIVIEDMYATIEKTQGTPPDVDMLALRKMIVIDHVTGPLGPINLFDLVRANRP
jgi:hypothetical protein